MEPDLIFFDEVEPPEITRRASLQRGTVTQIADPLPPIEPRRLIFEGKAMRRFDEWDVEMKAHFDGGLLDPLLEQVSTHDE